MKKTSLLWIAGFSIIVFWLILPGVFIKIPFTKASLPIKPKSIRSPFGPLQINIVRPLKLGLDLKGGSRLVFEINTKKVKSSEIDAAVEAARDTIERRVNFFGISEPNIVLLKSGSTYRVAVELPGVNDPKSAASLIGQTAQLEFRELKQANNQKKASGAAGFRFAKTKLTGAYLKKSRTGFDSQTGKPQVELTFNKDGAGLFAQITKRNINKPLAIFLDNQLVTSPVVQQEIKGGRAVITGDFTTEETKRLVSALNAGALPLPIKLVEQQSVEPTIGKQNVAKSILAGVVGLLSVVVFMLIMYRKNGVLALVSLSLYAIYSLFIFKYAGIVLTLSGVAGLLLSIGMAVDSNILIYERIKEELINQKNTKTATRIGFIRALAAIKDANINTLLVAFILFNPFNFSFLPLFGIVRGFAITLAIGVVLSLFTGVVITKNILWSIYKIDK